MRRLVPLLLCLLLLSSCAARSPLSPVTAPEDVTIPAPQSPATTQETATLWFRFDQEPLLAPEERSLDLSPTKAYELTLLEALLAGPSASASELQGLFPQGTRVLATTRQGRTLFVTLSRQIMNRYPDETEGVDTAESRLRRLLAMQSIAATVTENCDVDTVIVLVEQSDAVTDSLRLKESYYLTGSDAPAAPLKRDESLLLTPTTTLSTILQCWQDRDFARLYRYVARTDAATGQQRPQEAEFIAQMEGLPHLTQWAVSGGSVSGDRATLSALMHCADGGTASETAGVFRLMRERGLWKIEYSQLSSRKEAAP
ncbi:MAG: GerMN domain-containing protein [Clostridia bacterium]|nr:GerMN domain-containing protein [Clostridia bacterium]